MMMMRIAMKKNIHVTVRGVIKKGKARENKMRKRRKGEKEGGRDKEGCPLIGTVKQIMASSRVSINGAK